MSKAITILGKKNPKIVSVPNSDVIPRVDRGNSLIELRRKSGWIHYFGYGIVHKIYKGDRFDVAYINFGRGYESNVRVYFHDLNARKQLYTLKTGQYAMFGLMKHKDMVSKYPNDYMVEWAMGIYVPKMVDIRNTELEEKEIESMKETELKDGQTFLDLFIKNE